MESLNTALPYLYQYSYAGVFVLILVFSLTPLSKTLLIAAAGLLAARGVGELPAYLATAIVALVVADSAYYLLGRLGGERLGQGRWMRDPTRAAQLARAATLFHRHARLAVFSARFLPFVRSLIFIVAGINRMAWSGFVLADLLSACLYVPLALSLGYLVGANLEVLVALAERLQWWLAALVLVLSLVVIWWRRRP